MDLDTVPHSPPDTPPGLKRIMLIGLDRDIDRHDNEKK
jgi:hypothetical protein